MKNRGRPPRPVKRRFWEKIKVGKNNECWEWQVGRTIYGYGKFKIKLDGKWQSMNAHRVAWILSHGEIANGLEVCHKCDNRLCCNPAHLFIGTKADNNRDMTRKGRRARGETVFAKLTEHEVIEIRARYAAGGCSWRSLAEEHNVVKQTIGNVIKRRSWRHI